MQSDYGFVDDRFDEGFRLPYHYSAKKVSGPFRDALLGEYPRLRQNTPDTKFFCRMLDYILFPRWVQDDGRLPLPCRTVAALDGRDWNSHYKAIDRIRAFEDTAGLSVDAGGWSHQKGLARTVLPQLPQAMQDLLAAERHQAGKRRERVYMDTGEPVSRRGRHAQEKAQWLSRREGNILDVPAGDPRWLALNLLNTQSPFVQRQMVQENADAARELILARPDVLVRDQWLDILDEVVAGNPTSYRAVPNSPRVYAEGRSLNQFGRSVRECLLHGCIHLDMKAAQASIIATLWDIPLLRDYLDGGDFWGRMLTELGLLARDKPRLKTTLYAAIFGMSHRRLRNTGDSTDAGRLCGADAERFLSHSVVAALLEARLQRMDAIAKAEGVRTACGRWVAVPPMPVVSRSEHERCLRSALAQEVQSWEQRMMLPALRIAADRQSHGVHILSYLHDGLAVYTRDKRVAVSTALSLSRSITREASSFGIRILTDVS